jgi:hypothetical protein
MAKAVQPPTEVSAAAKAGDDDDDHRGIPHDAETAQYTYGMTTCEEGWQATQDPAFIIDAQILAHRHRQPSPAWLTDAITGLLIKLRAKSFTTNVASRALNLTRWKAVHDGHYGKGLSWEKAYEFAADELTETEAAGEPRTMKSSYQKVTRDIRAGRSDVYILSLNLSSPPTHAPSD